MKNPTDRYLLQKIFDTYYETYLSFDDTSKTRSSRNYVPIDCEIIAKKVEMDPNLVFGRLYYHLNKKHGYKNDNNSIVPLFSLKVGDDKHVINFPLLSAVLADLNSSFYRFLIPSFLSTIALVISVLGYFDVGA